MTVKEFCKKYDLKFQTVYKKIKNHKYKELAGHITKTKGASLELDDFAVDFLLPISVKVLQAVDECEGIARENDELKDKLYSAETIAEQTDKQLSNVLEKNEKLLAENEEQLTQIESLKNSLSEKESKIDTLTSELEALRCTFQQTVTELEKRVAELTEENRLLTEKLEAVPKFLRKNQ